MYTCKENKKFINNYTIDIKYGNYDLFTNGKLAISMGFV